MLREAMTIPPEEAGLILRDLGRIEADMLAILAAQERSPERIREFAKRSAATAAGLAEQFAALRVAGAPAKERPARKPRTRHAHKLEAPSNPLDFSGSFASLLRAL